MTLKLELYKNQGGFKHSEMGYTILTTFKQVSLV
jgi:hypothetical protein